MSGPAPMLPDFIIAGFPKAGTSSVHDWLAAHPAVLGSAPKETYYFVDPGTHMHDPRCHIVNGLEDYRRFFSHAESTKPPAVTVESTPAYVYGETALAVLPDLPSEPRFLFILREPAAQIYSLYSYFRNNWQWVPKEMDFATFLDAVRRGASDFGGNELCRNALINADYCAHLKKWRDRVGNERMRIMLFEDLLRDERQFMQDVSRWLGIDPGFYDSYDFPRENETYAVRSAAIQSVNIAIRRFLVPLGGVYRFLRGIYRRLNTRKPAGPSAEDQRVIRALRAEFAPANARLASEFGLDLSAWSPTEDRS